MALKQAWYDKIIMNKKVFVSLCVFGLVTVFLFFGGILGFFFTFKHLNNVRELEKSNIIENALITNIVKRARTFNNTIYFTTISDKKLYQLNLIKIIPGKINIGDEILVKFNDEKNLFLITNYSNAIYSGYIIQIVLFIFCFFLSILSLRGTISIYKNRSA